MKLIYILLLVIIFVVLCGCSKTSTCIQGTNEYFDIGVNNYGNEYVPFYVINLQSRPDRLLSMKNKLKQLNTNGIFLKAVNGNTLNVESLYNNGIVQHPKYSSDHNVNFWDNESGTHMKKKLTKGEIGCFISHLYVWDTIATSKHRYGLILEDDVDFADNFNNRMHDIIHQMRHIDWDIIYLGRTLLTCVGTFNKYDCYNGESVTQDVFKPREMGYGMFGLLMTKKCANMLLDKMYPTFHGNSDNNNYKIDEPIDVLIRYLYNTGKIKAYAVKPSSHLVFVNDLSDSDTVRIK